MPSTKSTVGRTRSVCAGSRPSDRIPGVSVLLALGALALLPACQFNEERALSEPAAWGRELPFVTPAIETTPVAAQGDAADDSVVLAGSESGWIVGTDKQYGLRIYALDGTEVQDLPVGRVNNVDSVRRASDEYLLAASNRTTQTIDLFIATFTADAIDVRQVGSLALPLEVPYGLCMATAGDGAIVFVGDKAGRVQEWRVDADLSGRLLREHRFDSQTEGCVVDELSGTLYVGEEAAGIWAVDLATEKRVLIDAVGAGRLTADVEGLDIYRGDDRVLIASSQGDHSFVAYRLPGGKPLNHFRVRASADRGIDGVSETDGVAISHEPLPGFPAGVMVVQDGYNRQPTAPQNFKIIDWREVSALLAR
jgi:3-phytase